jgi:hypothetical protein
VYGKITKIFITTLVLGLVAFSSVHVIPTQVTQGLITENQIADNAMTSPKIKDGEVKTLDLANGAVTKDKISPFALKLVTVERFHASNLPAHSQATARVECNKGEVVTGGGFDTPNPDAGTVTAESRPDLPTNSWVVGAYNPSDVTRLS